MIAYLRARQSGLIEPYADPAACAGILSGIQSQILHAAYTALGSRCPPGLTAADTEDMLLRDRTLLGGWGQRGTLHLYTPENRRLWLSALGGKASWFRRKYEAGGGDFEALRAAVLGELSGRERFTRSDLSGVAGRFGAEVLSAWGGILIDLSMQGLVCHLGRRGNETLYGFLPEGAGSLPLPEADAANTALTEAYFRAYGPAGLADFCHWRGVARSRALPWFRACTHRLTEYAPGLWMHRESQPPPPDPPADFVRLLYRFDPLLLAYSDKSWLVAEPSLEKRIWQKAAHVNPVVLGPRGALGLWNYQKKGQKDLAFSFEPFGPWSPAERSAVDAETERIAAFWQRRRTL